MFEMRARIPAISAVDLRRTACCALSLLSLLSLSPVVPPSRAEPAVRSAEPATNRPAGKSKGNWQTSLMQFAGQVREFGTWEEQYEVIQASIVSTWEENGWTEEPDLFGMDVAMEVSRIPPWQFMKRVQRMSEMVGDRYGFNQTQTRQFEGMMLREMTGFISEHANVIFDHSQQFMQMMKDGKAPDAELVKTWTGESQPLWKDALQRMERGKAEFRRNLSGKQLEIYDRDVKSLQKRVDFMNDMRKRWSEGKWSPGDWDLDDKNVQEFFAKARARLAAKAEAEQGAGGDRAQPSKWLPHDPNTWSAYARFVETRFSLDDAQRTKAKAIHDELVQRAARYLRSRAAVVEAVPVAERADHRDWQPVSLLFADLKRRVDALPTLAQRERVARASPAPPGS